MSLTTKNTRKPVIIGITGASGSILAQVVIDRLLDMEWPVIVTASSAARIVWRQEIEESFGVSIERWMDSGLFTHYAIGDLAAPIASGTFPIQGMAIVPCSMATAAAVATGISDNLLRRAADVTLKERRNFVVVPRETPMTTIHLSNLGTLSSLGAIILPPHPAFYLDPQDIADIVDFIAERVMLSLGVSDALPTHLQYESSEAE